MNKGALLKLLYTLHRSCAQLLCTAILTLLLCQISAFKEQEPFGGNTNNGLAFLSGCFLYYIFLFNIPSRI